MDDIGIVELMETSPKDWIRIIWFNEKKKKEGVRQYLEAAGCGMSRASASPQRETPRPRRIRLRVLCLGLTRLGITTGIR